MMEQADITKVENERQYAVIDQMLTMHSILRDRMERRAFWLNTALIVSSLFLLIFSFIGDDILSALGFDPRMTRFILGLVAAIVLVGSITEFRVDWRSVAGKHSEAALHLSTLKAKYRKSFAETKGNDPTANRMLAAEYDRVTTTLPSIPDRWFNTLKANHQYKKLLSIRISQHPRTPVWLLRTLLRTEGIREVLHPKKEAS
jgi:hypothetical protein